jgi:hypothetical protein
VILTSTDNTLVKQIDYSINGAAQPTVHGALFSRSPIRA